MFIYILYGYKFELKCGLVEYEINIESTSKLRLVLTLDQCVIHDTNIIQTFVLMLTLGLNQQFNYILYAHKFEYETDV